MGFVITVGIANVFAYPTAVFENQDNGNYKNHKIPTKRSNGLNDLADLQSQIAAFQLSQGPLMSAMKEAFIRSFKHKMDFDISTSPWKIRIWKKVSMSRIRSG